MTLYATGRVGRARDVRAGVNATKVDARPILRAAGVPEAHGRGGRTAVRAYAHGPVVEHQALAVGRAWATAIARAPALTVARAPQVRSAVAVGPALARRRRASELALLADGEPVLARAPSPVVADRARPRRFARQPVARVPARAVRGARPGRRAVGVGRAPGRGHVVVPGPHARPRFRCTAHGRVAGVTVRARALRPVQHRPAQRVQATSAAHATRVHATSADACLFVRTLTVVGTFDRCMGGTRVIKTNNSNMSEYIHGYTYL